MRLSKVPRTALDLSLRLVRAPVDAAIDLVPGNDSGPRAVAHRVVEAVDSAARALLGLAAEDRDVRWAPSDPAPEPAPQGRGRAERQSAPAARAPADPRPAPTARPPADPRPAPAARAPAGPRRARQGRPPADPHPAPEAPAPPPSHEKIAARAFELYEHGVPGDAESHWRAAERELSGARDS